MIGRRIWLVCLVMGVLLSGGITGCQSAVGVDEEARSQLTALETSLSAVQATTEALAAGAAGATAVLEPGITREMSLRTALEVILQDGQPPVSAFFPIDRMAFYKSYDEFKEDWTSDNKDLHSWVKLAFLPDPTPEAWQLYYNTDVISDTVNWTSPGWRSYIIKANWQSDEVETGILSGEVLVDPGEKLPINGQTVFLTGTFMSESLDNLETVVTTNGGDLLSTFSPMMFLVHDGSEGHDDLVLALIEDSSVGPDPWQDPPVEQYCGRCSSFMCRWRCWRY